MGGTCSTVDGGSFNAPGPEACWAKGGVKWNPGFGGRSVDNPNIPAAIATLQPQNPVAAKAVEDAKKATEIASVATVAAGKAEATAVAAKQNADDAAAAANDARTVRDKCIKTANEAHQAAMKACGPELGAKEGFGESEGFGFAGQCSMMLLFFIIVLVFVAMCMQGEERPNVTIRDSEFTISPALV